MKFKHFFTLAVAIFAFTFAGYSQVEQEEAPMFGKTRGFGNPSMMHNFGAVAGDVKTFEFKIKNLGTTPMKIVDVQIPEQVGVTIMSKTIKPGANGQIIVTVNPEITDAGKFSKKIIVLTEQVEPGVITKQERTYSVSGVVE